MSAQLHWPVRQMQSTLEALLPGLVVEAVASIGSTSTELMQRVRQGDRRPVLLVAERQNAGRGRLGRNWQSEGTSEGASETGAIPSLTFSLALPLAPRDWSGLSLAVGVAVVHSLHPALRLKWPNDIWLEDRKLGGILIETAAQGDLRHVVIGIGLNLLPREVQGLSTPLACLHELLPQVSAPDVLQQLAPALLRGVLQFERDGFSPFRQAFLERDALAGREIGLSDGTLGHAAGVDAAGALLVRTPVGMQAVHSNEVSVRPVAAAVAAGWVPAGVG